MIKQSFLNIVERTTTISNGLFVLFGGARFSESGQILVLLLALVAALPAEADGELSYGIKEDLFSLASSPRAELTSFIYEVESYCAQVHGPTAREASACRWPDLVRESLSALDRLASLEPNQTFGRARRLSGHSLSIAERIQAGSVHSSAKIVPQIEFLHATESLYIPTRNLITSLNSPSWTITRLQHPDFAPVAARIRLIQRFAAWVRSENLIGYLRQLVELGAEQSQEELQQIASCLVSPSRLRDSLKAPDGLLSRHRLTFKEVDVARAAWGQPVPGMLSQPHDYMKPNLDLSGMLATLEEADLSLMGSELNECRALAWALAAASVDEHEIDRLRLICESARQKKQPLWVEDLPGSIIHAQRAIVLAEARRQRGPRSNIRLRHAVGLYRDLLGVDLGKEPTCDKPLSDQLNNMQTELNQLINGSEMEDL